MRPVFAILAVAVSLVFVGVATAQQGESHKLIDDWGRADVTRSAGEMGKQLRSSLGTRPPQTIAGVPPELFKQIQEMVLKDPEKWRKFLDGQLTENAELRERLKKVNLTNPELRHQILDPANGGPRNSDRRIQDQTGQRLNDMQQSLRPRPRGSAGRPSIPMPPDAQTGPPNPEAPKAASGSAVTLTKPPTSGLPGASPSPNTPSPTGNDARTREFLKSMERWFPKSMGDSPTMKRVFSDLSNKDWGKIADATFDKTGKGTGINWDRVGNRLHGTGRFLDRNMPNLSSRRLPDMPNLNAPSLPRGPDLSGVGGPSIGGAGGAGSSFTVLLVIAALLAGGYLLWRLVLRPMQLAKQRTDTATDIGPWPVDPARIKTRAELVTAFDYLALRSCGKSARMWHHREVANRLGIDDIQRRQVAMSLAEMYAHARYSPPNEALAEPVALRARHDLCALAGEALP